MFQPSTRPLFVEDIIAGDAQFPLGPMPRAGEEPINLDAALRIIAAQAPCPHQADTIAILLDEERRGLSIMVVHDTEDHDAVIFVAQRIAEARGLDGAVDAVILASFRPGGRDELDDIERWWTLDETLGAAGIELIEWFVIGGKVSRPRTLADEASR